VAWVNQATHSLGIACIAWVNLNVGSCHISGYEMLDFKAYCSSKDQS